MTSAINDKIRELLISEDLSDDDRTFLHLEIKQLVEAEKKALLESIKADIEQTLFCVGYSFEKDPRLFTVLQQEIDKHLKL